MPTPSLEQVKDALNNAPNGANIILEWERDVKTLKAHSDLNIRKHVIAVGRKGMSYENLKAVKEKRENGELPSEPKPTWFYHDDSCKGIIRHKRTEAPYVQLFGGTDTRHIPKVKFTLNGEETTLEAISPYILSSEKRSEKGDTFCCKVADMITIKTEVVPMATSDEEVQTEVA
jgi:hypothetical protein